MANSSQYEFPWEESALRGAPLPKGLKYEESFLYEALSSVYCRYHSGKITKDQGAAEKKYFINRYEQLKAQEQLSMRQAKIYREVEYLAQKYHENPCLETADLMMNVIYGEVFKDDSGK